MAFRLTREGFDRVVDLHNVIRSRAIGLVFRLRGVPVYHLDKMRHARFSQHALRRARRHARHFRLGGHAPLRRFLSLRRTASECDTRGARLPPLLHIWRKALPPRRLGLPDAHLAHAHCQAGGGAARGLCITCIHLPRPHSLPSNVIHIHELGVEAHSFSGSLCGNSRKRQPHLRETCGIPANVKFFVLAFAGTPQASYSLF